MKPFFSIITPCFNSSATLLDTYKSLLNQEFICFEWILVDDASNDNGKTIEIIKRIEEEAPFKVKTILLESNYFGSKSTFLGSNIADGKYIAILDHDDQLTQDCLNLVYKHLSNNLDENLAGICGRCVGLDNYLIGRRFPKDFFIAKEGDVRFKMKITCELFQFTKKEIIQSYFKEMRPGYTNGVAWANISENYNYIYVNDTFRIYNTTLPTSYSNTKSMLVRYPQNKAEALKITISSYRTYLRFNPIYSSRLITSFLRHTINAKIKFRTAISEFDPILKIWASALYPIAILKSRNII